MMSKTKKKLKKGDLVKLRDPKIYDGPHYGVVTGFSNTGWVFITWANGVVGQWPYHKVKFIATGKINEKQI